jgi:hypothetical protein
VTLDRHVTGAFNAENTKPRIFEKACEIIGAKWSYSIAVKFHTKPFASPSYSASGVVKRSSLIFLATNSVQQESGAPWTTNTRSFIPQRQKARRVFAGVICMSHCMFWR